MNISDIISIGSLIVAVVSIITSYFFQKGLLKKEKLHQKRMDELEKLYKQLIMLKNKLIYFKECNNYDYYEYYNLQDKEAAIVEIGDILMEIKNQFDYVSAYFKDNDRIIKSIRKIFESNEKEEAIMQNTIFLKFMLLIHMKKRLILDSNEVSVTSEVDYSNDEINHEVEKIISLENSIYNIDENDLESFVDNSINIIKNIEKDYKRVIAVKIR